MKTLPTLRDKKRYIAFEINSPQLVTRQELVKGILNSIAFLFGDRGMSEINPALMSLDDKFGIIRCRREKTIETRIGLACIGEIQGMPVSIVVLGISGTIKGATEKFIQQSLINKSGPKENKELNSLDSVE